MEFTETWLERREQQGAVVWQPSSLFTYCIGKQGLWPNHQSYQQENPLEHLVGSISLCAQVFKAQHPIEVRFLSLILRHIIHWTMDMLSIKNNVIKNIAQLYSRAVHSGFTFSVQTFQNEKKNYELWHDQLLSMAKFSSLLQHFKPSAFSNSMFGSRPHWPCFPFFQLPFSI